MLLNLIVTDGRDSIRAIISKKNKKCAKGKAKSILWGKNIERRNIERGRGKAVWVKGGKKVGKMKIK